MTFKEIIDMTLYRIDVEVTDPEVESLAIVKNGINQAYMIIASTVDQKTATASFAYSESINLPNDFISLVNLKSSVVGDLSEVDYYIIANLLYVKSKAAQTGTLTLTYVKTLNSLKNDNDIIELKDIYTYALTAYGAYVYQLYRKKYSAATMLLQEFNALIGGNLKNEVEGNI